MRCECCNTILTDFEATRRSSETGEFLMICNRCLSGLDIATVEREEFRLDSDDVLDHDVVRYNDNLPEFTDSDLWLSSDDR